MILVLVLVTLEDQDCKNKTILFILFIIHQRSKPSSVNTNNEQLLRVLYKDMYLFYIYLYIVLCGTISLSNGLFL